MIIVNSSIFIPLYCYKTTCFEWFRSFKIIINSKYPLILFNTLIKSSFVVFCSVDQFLENLMSKIWNHLIRFALITSVGPGQVAQLVRESSQNAKVSGLIPGQGTYEKQPMYA